MQRTLATWTAALALLGTASTASAQTHFTKEDYPRAVTARPLTLPQWMVELHVEALIDLSRGRAFKDISLPPDVSLGITDDFTLGINHSQTMGVVPYPGAAPFCIGGENCVKGKVYDQVALDAKYQVIRKEQVQLAVHGILGGESLSPFGLALRGGVSGRWRPADIFALDFDPGLGIGITNRKTFGPKGGVFRGVASGNQEFLYLPLRATVQATEAVSAYVDLYFLAPFDQFSHVYRFGVNVGLAVAVTNRIDVGPEFRLPTLLSGNAYDPNLGDANTRQIGGFANFRF